MSKNLQALCLIVLSVLLVLWCKPDVEFVPHGIIAMVQTEAEAISPDEVSYFEYQQVLAEVIGFVHVEVAVHTGSAQDKCKLMRDYAKKLAAAVGANGLQVDMNRRNEPCQRHALVYSLSLQAIRIAS